MEFKFIHHSQISEHEIDKIVSLKNIHWNYSTVEHKNWITINIKKDDIHVLMFENEVLVGYMNLIQTEALLNSENFYFLGIGNVCAKEKRRGYGEKLLIEVNNYLTDNNKQGILFCKDELISFYKKYNWLSIDKHFTTGAFSQNINVMLFNLDYNIKSFNYTGRNF